MLKVLANKRNYLQCLKLISLTFVKFLHAQVYQALSILTNKELCFLILTHGQADKQLGGSDHEIYCSKFEMLEITLFGCR